MGLVGDSDGLVDDALVPILDQPLGAQPLPPGRVISGKKKQAGGSEDDDGKATRRCMCCDSRVRVPKDLERFRCMCCLTINDLAVPRGNGNGDGKTLGRDALNSMKMPLSVERTRAIIESCLTVYLQDRCKRHEERVETLKSDQASASLKKPIDAIPTQPAEDDRNRMIAVPTRQHGKLPVQLNDTPVSRSPRDAPGPLADFSCSAPTAVIRSFDDFDLFAGTRTDTPPRSGSNLLNSPPSNPMLPPPVPRRPLPSQPTRKPPPPPVDAARRMPPPTLRQSSAPSIAVNDERSSRPQQSPRLTSEELEQRKRYDRVKVIFRPLEDYMLETYGDYECLNSSFSTVRPAATGRTKSESHIVTPPPEPTDDKFSPSPVNMFSELDAKMLLLGDIGENGSWWAADRGDKERSDRMLRNRKGGSGTSKPVSSKSPNINWNQLALWYELVHTAGKNWRHRMDTLVPSTSTTGKSSLEGSANLVEIDEDLAEAREHAVRAL